MLAIACIALAACGGGSGGSAGPSEPPVISGVSGTFNHRLNVRVSGSGFGFKSPAAPVVWDNGDDWHIGVWDGFWPDNSGPAYDVNYRPMQRSIPMPHSRVTRYITGAHFPGTDFDSGYNVIFWKNRTISSYPAYTYMSWYQRIDDAWAFGIGGPPDDNLKVSAFSVCCSPYELPNNWYVEYNPRPTNTTNTPGWHIVDDAEGQPQESLQDPDVNGQNSFWDSAVNPMSGVWTKIEQEVKYSRQSDGYIRLWENGVLKINYAGPTDRYAGNSRTEGIGGYARAQGSTNNWRYFSDAYLDHTRARVVLANNATPGLATIIETQVPTSWTDSSITFDVNLGRLTSGTAYLFVVNPSGLPSGSGFPVTIP